MTNTPAAITEAKNRARSLEKFMKKQGVQLPYTQYLEAIAQLDHQVTWQVFVAREQTAAEQAQAPIEALARIPDTMLAPAISSKAHSDDYHFEIEFNAAGWFAQADDDKILGLSSINWGGDEEADVVALFFESANAELADMFDYCRSTARSRNAIGFECNVDEEDAMAWLKIHRPGVWARILCEQADVSIVAAEEPELQGMFDWLQDDVACDRSFGSEADAALDAVEQLGLAQAEI